MSNLIERADRTAADVRRDREAEVVTRGPKLPGELADWKIGALVVALALFILYCYLHYRGG